MLPGRTYGLDDVLRAVRRHGWLLVLPAVVMSALAAVGTTFVPERYRAETTILVVPQRVPETYVKSTVTARIEDRLQSISQQILSRARLERIIKDLNLYERERRTGIMEDVVDQMRGDITVQVVKGDAFRVTYTGRNPETVMKVTERLASMFIDENLRDREVLADETSQFLQAQLDDARSQLVSQERKLEEYRKKFSGQLPSQVDSNLQAIHNAELQLQALTDSMNHDRDRQLIVERMLADLTPPEPSGPTVVRTDGEGTTRSDLTVPEQLDAARDHLRALQTRLTPEHPDVVAARRVIAELEAKAAAEARSPTPVRPASAAADARTRRVAELRSELDLLDQELARGAQAEQQLRATIADYRRRVEALPSRESEMAELTRDYTTLQSLYTGLLAKKEESIIAANLERRQIGEQFKLLDPAQLPQKPFSPNRPLIDAAALALGLAIGAVAVARLEYRDATFRLDGDITRALSLPVLATIPMMQSAAERRRNRRRRFAEAAVLGSVVAACIAVVAYTLR